MSQRRPDPVVVGLATAVALVGAVGLISVFIAVAYGLGWTLAALVFVAAAVVIGGAIYGWLCFASRLR